MGTYTVYLRQAVIQIPVISPHRGLLLHTQFVQCVPEILRT